MRDTDTKNDADKSKLDEIFERSSRRLDENIQKYFPKSGLLERLSKKGRIKPMPRDTEEFWRGSFGDSYLERNRIDWKKRVPFWDHMLGMTDAMSVLEVGCNAGWNLMAMREGSASPLCLCGVDVNVSALREARYEGLTVWHQSASDPLGRSNFDLVFTVGVLIHVPQESLNAAMRNIVKASRRYVLAVEYADEQEVEVEYRGHSGTLWRRPFGKLYEGMGLKMVETGLLTKEEGFDNTTYWLLSK